MDKCFKGRQHVFFFIPHRTVWQALIKTTKINLLKPDFQKGSLINSDKLTAKPSVALCDKDVGQFDTLRATIASCLLWNMITKFRYNKQKISCESLNS